MHTKVYTIVATVIVYCMVLVAFKQHQHISEVRFERLARQPVAGWDLIGLAGGLTSAVAESEPDLTPVVVAETKPEPRFDPILSRTIREFNDDISRQDSERLASLIEGTANMYGVDPYLVTALLSQESAFYQSAVSPVGALGLGQLMPETAADLGVNPAKPEENLDGCVRYLAQNLDTWAHTADPVALALASYNAGPGAVEQYGGIPPYEETQHYVAVIKYRYDLLRSSRA
jgi:soluble lytic murein transglycosylase-like protein